MHNTYSVGIMHGYDLRFYDLQFTILRIYDFTIYEFMVLRFINYNLNRLSKIAKHRTSFWIQAPCFLFLGFVD